MDFYSMGYVQCKPFLWLALLFYLGGYNDELFQH